MIKQKMNKGDRHGSLVFTGEHITRDRRQLGVFDCDCGLKKTVRLDIVYSGNTKSCGCKSPNKDYKVRQKDFGEDYPFKVIWNKFAGNAKKRKKEFTITIQDIKDCYIKQKGLCAYSKIPIDLPKNFLRIYDKAILSIDRIDSSIGYIPGNIQLVTKTVNMMKQELSHDEFIRMCTLIAKTGGESAIPTR